ncbi:DNA-directed RNA polymerase sigma-70 factor [Betaproteobacteria bacterium]|nr:DNA-directed RNA polymerase sigma-70 factor [Betaproteobacteria bacterium]GHU11382.1 DNA-directed RNA polymerase sigma-70 factor [Betaproteobacteria bacterium]GHU16203.1 DNA-directed RNA polymerase sigma-70 factor [Betaproteobacteria bacterium]
MSAQHDIPPDQLPDEDLMLLITQGIIEAPVAELFRRHNRALFNFIAWSCQGNTAEAEDICQKTWLKLMHCASYQPSAAFRTFLYQIARNLLIDARRSAYAQHDALDDHADAAPESDITPEVELGLRQNLHRVRQAMMTLPVLQREVVVLRFFAELSLEEIAAAVGVGFETVKSRLRYAFAHLRRELGQVE